MIIGRVSRHIASGIGLGRESYLQHKQKKTELASHDVAAVTDETNETEHVDDPEHGDEHLWSLDEIGEQERQPTNAAFEEARDTEGLVKAFTDLHPSALIPKDENMRLHYPVCIPQRRPRHRTHGFVRAYAPDLELVGIDQDTFLDFLNGFEKSVKMHQNFNAVQGVVKGADLALQIAAGGSLLLHAASFVIHASVEAGRRAYVYYKTNEYLDRMNEVLFRPHGLYAVIMCYKPKDDGIVGDTANEAVARRADGHGNKFSRKSGTTKSELELPEAAPLIFPDVDKLPDDKKPSVTKRFGAFYSDYEERRSQAQFRYDYPDSKLSVQEAPKFASRYADPTSTAANGGLLGLLSGGKVTAPRYYLKQNRRKSKLQAGKSVAPRSRLLTEDVLYLMVVNLPSDAEIAEAKHLLLHEQAV